MKNMNRFLMIVGAITLLGAAPLKGFSLSLVCKDLHSFAYSTFEIQPVAEGVLEAKLSGNAIQLIGKRLGIHPKKDKLDWIQSIEFHLPMSELIIAEENPLLVKSSLGHDINVTFQFFGGERITKPLFVILDTAQVRSISNFDLNVSETVEARLTLHKKDRVAPVTLDFLPQECSAQK